MFEEGMAQRPFNTAELQVLHRIFEHSRPSDLVIEVSAEAVHLTEGTNGQIDGFDKDVLVN